jgi:quinol monooxygenase YgiN
MRKLLCLVVVAVFVLGAVEFSLALDNNGKKITVFARIKIKPGFEEAGRAALLGLVPLTRQEPGCINYDMHVGVGTEPGDYKTEKKNYFMFYENWRSRLDWDKHMNMPYLQEWGKLCNGTPEKPGICAEPPEVTIWEMIDSPSNPVFRGTLPGPEKYTLSALVSIKDRQDPSCTQVQLPAPYPPAARIPDCVDRSYKEMLALVPLTHLEPGCINYEMHVGLKMDDNARNYRKYLFYENWYDFNVWKYDHMGASYLVNWFNLVPIVTESVNGAVLEGWKMITGK